MRISRKIAGFSMLGAMALQMVSSFAGVAAAAGAVPVKLRLSSQFGKATPIKLVLESHWRAEKMSLERKAIGLSLVSTLIVLLFLTVGAGSGTAFMGYGEPTFFGSAGSGPGQFKEPMGIAVNDATNDVYVVDQGNNRVEMLDANGTYLSQFNGSDDRYLPGTTIPELGV